MAAFGAPLEELTPDEFLDRDGFFRMGRPPLMIEILPSIKGVEFDHAWERRIDTVIDVDTGLSVFMISREDLIASKLAAARPQDLADVDAIRNAVEGSTHPTARRPTES